MSVHIIMLFGKLALTFCVVLVIHTITLHTYVPAPLHRFSLRVLEMKHEMVNLELLEFHYFDDILMDMKLTPVSIPLHL